MTTSPEPRWSTVVDILRWRAAHDADRLGYTYLTNGDDEESHLTYGELDRRARSIATLIREMGAGGQPVLLVFPAGLEFISAFFGCLYAGSIAVGVLPPRPNRSLDRFGVVARDSGAGVILTTDALRRRIEPVAAEMKGPRLTWISTDGSAAQDPDAWVAPEIDDHSVALLQYTSGSTASPRGTMVSHGNMLHNSQIICEAFEASRRSVAVGWLPLTHDMGLIGNVLQPLNAGCRGVFMAPEHFLVRPIRWLRAVSRYRATTSGGPNNRNDETNKRGTK